MSGSDKVYIPEWMPERPGLAASDMVSCNAVETPHLYSVCSCTAGHKNPQSYKSEVDWATIYHHEVVGAKDRLTQTAHKIVYIFASKQHGDLYSNENFVKAVRRIKKILEEERHGRPVDYLHPQ
jgi:hypothetical protein